MPYFLIWSQRFQLAINCIFLTITFETGLVRNVSQDDSIPFAHLTAIFQLCALKLKTNCWNIGDSY